MVGNLLVTAIALHGPEVSAARHSDKQRRGTQIGKKKKKTCLGEESQEKPKEEIRPFTLFGFKCFSVKNQPTNKRRGASTRNPLAAEAVPLGG